MEDLVKDTGALRPSVQTPHERTIEGSTDTTDAPLQPRLGELQFYRGKRVFITGHTGFKGSWLCRMLVHAGATVHGYALTPDDTFSLFTIANIGQDIESTFGDIRDVSALERAFNRAQPDIVIHLAAQPLVRESYQHPRETYEINVMGTVNVMECARKTGNVQSILNVTTDKVYRDNGNIQVFSEEDFLDGADPYSNSKSCSELVTHCYQRSFLSSAGAALSTARAGNVIGGGDFARDRLVPDCVRAVLADRPIVIRNPRSVRPFHHVLESLGAYLMIARAQYDDAALAGWYNVGPRYEDCLSAGALADEFCTCWGESARWEHHGDNGPYEAARLQLDSTLIRKTFGWHPVWDVHEAIYRTVEWTRAGMDEKRASDCLDEQIERWCATARRGELDV